MRQISTTVKHLLIINTIVFVCTYFIGNRDFFYATLSLRYPLNDAFMPWQVLSHMFMHGGLTHLLFNMFALFMFGGVVERVLGQRKFIIFYLSCGLGAVALTLGIYYVQALPLINELNSEGYSLQLIKEVASLDIVRDNMFQGQILANKMEPIFELYSQSMSQLTPDTFKSFFDLNVKSSGSMVGASGAIMGVLVAFGMLNPNAELMLIFLPIPVKAKYFIPAIIGLDLFSAITGQSIFSPSNTAYVAHIGGAVTGFFLMYFWKKNRFDNIRWY